MKAYCIFLYKVCCSYVAWKFNHDLATSGRGLEWPGQVFSRKNHPISKHQNISALGDINIHFSFFQNLSTNCCRKFILARKHILKSISFKCINPKVLQNLRLDFYQTPWMRRIQEETNGGGTLNLDKENTNKQTIESTQWKNFNDCFTFFLLFFCMELYLRTCSSPQT